MPRCQEEEKVGVPRGPWRPETLPSLRDLAQVSLLVASGGVSATTGGGLGCTWGHSPAV